MTLNPMAAQIDAINAGQEFLQVLGTALLVVFLLGIGVSILHAITRRDP